MVSIGIDIGGTSIKGAAVNQQGQILDRFQIRTDFDPEGVTTINSVIKAVKDLIDKNNLANDVVGIGLGVPGCIDGPKGIVKSSPNLKWENLHIKDMIEGALHYPVRVINDANAAALGESRYGSGKNYNSLVMITLGTGIGGGVVIDKKLFEGEEGQGAELGHAVIELNGRQCSCGRRGCFETYASATGLVLSTKEAMEAHPESILHKLAKERGRIDARIAFEAYRRGDPAGVELIDKYVYYLSEGLLNYCNIFRPNVITLSGGIANVGELLIDKVNNYLKEHNYGFKNAPIVKVVQSELGYDSGIIGAACLWL